MQNRRDSILKALLGIVLWLAVSGTVSAAAGAVFGMTYTAADETLLTGISSAVLIPIFLFLGKRWNVLHPFGRQHKHGLFAKILGMAAAAGSGAALSLAYGEITGMLHLTEVFSNETQEMFFSASLPVQIIALGFLTPVSEELLFRGIVFGSLKRCLPETCAVLVTSAIFALCHGNPIQMFYAFPMAFVIQLFYRLNGSLKAPAVLHICANLTSVFIEYYLH